MVRATTSLVERDHRDDQGSERPLRALPLGGPWILAKPDRAGQLPGRHVHACGWTNSREQTRVKSRERRRTSLTINQVVVEVGLVGSNVPAHGGLLVGVSQAHDPEDAMYLPARSSSWSLTSGLSICAWSVMAWETPNLLAWGSLAYAERMGHATGAGASRPGGLDGIGLYIVNNNASGVTQDDRAPAEPLTDSPKALLDGLTNLCFFEPAMTCSKDSRKKQGSRHAVQAREPDQVQVPRSLL